MNDKPNYVGTPSGGTFHFLNPDPDEVCIKDIAHNLARLARWNGATTSVLTVAQHSVVVAEMLRHTGYPFTIQMQGLMHDAAEAYLGDIPSPIKQHLPDFKAMEMLVEDAIFKRFDIPYPLDPVVKMMDTEAYRWEYRDLMVGDAVTPPLTNRSPYRTWSTEISEARFLNEFDLLNYAMHQERAA